MKNFRTSNKQIGMVAGCPRRWAAHYLFGYPEQKTEPLIDGERVHAQCQALLLGRQPPYPPEDRYAKMARALVEHVPPGRSHREQIELVRDVDVRPGLAVQLRPDYINQPWLVDWKTTGAPTPKAQIRTSQGPKSWALQSLRGAYQPQIYSKLLFSLWDVSEVALRWVFVSKKFAPGATPRTWLVEDVFTRDYAEEWWLRYVEPAVELLLGLRAAFDAGLLDSPQDVPYDSEDCDGEGKFCDYAGHCRFVPPPDGAPTLVQLRIPHPERNNRE